MGKESDDSFWDIEELLPNRPQKKTGRLTAVFDTDAVPVELGASDEKQGEPIPAVRPDKGQQGDNGVNKKTVSYEYGSGFIGRVEISPWPSSFTFYTKFRRDALRFFDRTSDPCEYVYFFSYMPQYDQMTVSQLSYYLYWRSCVRQGNYPKTDINYLFLYIYEIINLPDRVPAAQGALMLSRLWAAYRADFLYLDKYLGEWLCDYCLIHRVSPDWEIVGAFAGEVAGRVSMPEFYLKEGRLTWPVIESLSTYDYRTSKFYAEHKETFDRHIPVAAERAVQKHVAPCLADYGVGPVCVRRDSFSGAVACHAMKYKLTVHCTPLRRSLELKQALTGIVKLCENGVRAAMGIKSRFSPSGVSAQLKQEITAYFGELYPKQTTGRKKAAELEEERYLALYEPENRGPADIGRAMEIEAAAWEVAELLGTEEDEALSEPVAQETSAIFDAVEIPDDPAGVSAETEDEFAFLSELDGFWREALCAAADGRFDAFCRDQGKLAYTVCAEINERSMESLGDIIIQEEDFSLVPDYEEQVRAALGMG